MNIISRGIRNAFRNGVRTLSIVIILGLSIGLSLTMLIAHKAVENKIASVKSSIGNTITISPAGYSAFSQANNSLTSSELSKISSLANVTSVNETLTDRLSNSSSGSTSLPFGGSSTTDSNNTTNLTSPITLNANKGGGQSGGNFHVFISGGGSLPTNFSLPITIIGTNQPTEIDGSSITITSGKAISGSDTGNDALVSKMMASKNNLSVGSTFTAYSTTMTVAGIFTTSSESTAGSIIVSLPTEQRLSGQSGDVTSATVTVNSLDNLSSVTSAIKNKLGSSADVESAQEQANETVAPLNSVKNVSLFSLIGAVIAGGVIILLTMIMVVRERKREIGVVKAIGGSNIRIMAEFMIESLTLTILGAIIGLLIGVIGGQPVTKMLVNNTTTSTSTTTSSQAPGGPGGASGAGGAGPVVRNTQAGSSSFRGLRRNGAVRSFSNINAQIGWGILLDGFGAAILISVIGSALAAGMISKVRPSEVLRSI